MINDLIPWVDSHFRSIPDKDHRAMAGLSMGGRQTATVTMANLDKFSYIGLFSGGAAMGWRAAVAARPGAPGAAPAPAAPAAPDFKTIYNGQMADPAEFNRKVKVLFMSFGTEPPLENAEGLKTAPGTAHRRTGSPRATSIFLPAPRTNGRPGDEVLYTFASSCSSKTRQTTVPRPPKGTPAGPWTYHPSVLGGRPRAGASPGGEESEQRGIFRSTCRYFHDVDGDGIPDFESESGSSRIWRAIATSTTRGTLIFWGKSGARPRGTK